MYFFDEDKTRFYGSFAIGNITSHAHVVGDGAHDFPKTDSLVYLLLSRRKEKKKYNKI